MCLSFILFIIKKKQTREKKVQSEETKRKNSLLEIELIYHDKIEVKKSQKYKIIAVTSILDVIQTILSTNESLAINIKMWMFDFLFISILSYFLLKTKIYAHHYVSMILIIIAGITLDLIEKNYQNEFNENNEENNDEGTKIAKAKPWLRLIIKFVLEIVNTLDINTPFTPSLE